MGYGPGPNDFTEILNNLLRSNYGQIKGATSNLPDILRSIGGPLSGSGITRNLPRGASPAGPSGQLGGGIGGILSGATQRLNSLRGQPQQQQEDPLMKLYNDLISQLSSPVNMPTGVNTEDLMNQVKSALNPLYDDRANRAQGQSDRARGEVKDMYRALSNDYERLAPQQAEQAKAAQQEIEQMYGQLQSNIEGNYSRVSKEQSDLFQKLGIESALPDVLEEQQPAVTDALTAAAENQTQQEQRYMDIGQMDQSYYREGSPIATMRGNEISTDLLSQLQDYLSQNEAERTSGIQSAYMDQLGQANNNLTQQQQTSQNEAARRQEMLWSILQSQMSGGSSGSPLDQFMSSLSPQQQQSVGSAFTQLQRSPEAIYGKVEDPRNPTPGTFVETTPEWYMQQADQMLQSGQISPQDHQALLYYIQMYYKMGQ